MAKTSDTPTRAPKRTIPPREKAQLALDVAQRKLDKANEKTLAAHAAYEAARRELPDLQKQVDYLAANPLLAPAQEAQAIPAQQDPAEL